MFLRCRHDINTGTPPDGQENTGLKETQKRVLILSGLQVALSSAAMMIQASAAVSEPHKNVRAAPMPANCAPFLNSSSNSSSVSGAFSMCFMGIKRLASYFIFYEPGS